MLGGLLNHYYVDKKAAWSIPANNTVI
jgi:hypothetical protein